MEGRNKPVTRFSATVYPDDGSILHSNDQQNRPCCLKPWMEYLLMLGLAVAIGGVVTCFIISAIADVYQAVYPEIRVDSFSVSNFTSTNGSLVSFAAEIRLAVRNPSGLGSISYDQHMVAGMYYKSMLLSQSSLAPFSQKPRNKTSLVVELAADGNAVEKWVVDAMNADIGQNGRAEFAFALASWVNWDSKMVTSRIFLKVFCASLTVAIPSDGSPGGLIDSPGNCLIVRIT